MGIEITDLNSLPAAAVATSLAETVQRMQEANPTLDLRRGVLHDLVAYFHALLDAQVRSGAIDRYLSARSLLDIQNDPTLADPEFVDAVLSNYNVARGAGASARGRVTVVLDSPASVTIGSGAVFAAAGRTYAADSAFTAKPEAGQINDPTDRLLTELSDGNWAFAVDVTAQAVGTDSLLKKGTLVVPAALPGGYVTSYAADDFTGGLDPQTNDELLALLREGIAAKAPASRTSLSAMLRQQPAFARVVADSVVGFGDADMLRDRHTIWPGSLGGKADWYVRTTERAVRTTLTVSAALAAKNADGTGTWQLSLGRDDAPGFYEVVSVVPAGGGGGTAGSLPLSADVRGLDLSPVVDGGFVPDVAAVAEGAYTRFQTAVVRFTDTVTDHADLAVGAAADYDVTVVGFPQVADVQDFVSGVAVRAAAADVLVKAPVPCFVTLYFRIAKAARHAGPDLTAVRDAVARAVNLTPFSGRLYAAHLQDVVGGLLAEGVSVGSIDMLGRIRDPRGTVRYLRSDEVLAVDEIDGTMVSPKTVQFLLDSEDIHVDVSTEIPSPA